MEKLFHLKENNTTARTEIVAGLTTFMTMAYIIALNPNLLTGFGAQGGSQLWNGVFLATCIASAVGTLVMAFAANKPFAMAPGMGLNSFFAVGVANIVSDAGFNPECVGNGVDGLIVRPRNVGSLVEAMRSVIEDRGLLARLKRNSYEDRVNYDVATWKREVLDVVCG